MVFGSSGPMVPGWTPATPLTWVVFPPWASACAVAIDPVPGAGHLHRVLAGDFGRLAPGGGCVHLLGGAPLTEPGPKGCAAHRDRRVWRGLRSGSGRGVRGVRAAGGIGRVGLVLLARRSPDVMSAGSCWSAGLACWWPRWLLCCCRAPTVTGWSPIVSSILQPSRIGAGNPRSTPLSHGRDGRGQGKIQIMLRPNSAGALMSSASMRSKR